MYKCSVTCLIEGPYQPQLIRRDRVAASPVAALLLAVERLLKDVSMCETKDELSKSVITLVATVLRFGGNTFHAHVQEQEDDADMERADAKFLRDLPVVPCEEIIPAATQKGGV